MSDKSYENIAPHSNQKVQESPISRRDSTGDIPSVSILGIQVHNVSFEQALKILGQMALSGKPHHIMTVNPEFIMLARSDDEFKQVLKNAQLVLPDGIGIILAARILGKSLIERVTGVDTVSRLARIARDHGLSLFLLGAAPGVAEKAASVLQAENPGLKIAGTYSGSPSPAEENTICSIIENVRPHILLVAYGPPKQDLWIARTQMRLQIPVAIGVGGTFDFIAGIARRAPLWMQNVGLEWLFRLINEPQRWRRQLTLPKFVVVVLKARFQQSFSGKKVIVQ